MPELPGHMHAEEVTLYAHLRDRVPEEIRRSLDEHNEVRATLARFERIPLRDGAWLPGLRELREDVEAHFTTEEQRVFALAEQHLSKDNIFGLTETFQREKEARTDCGDVTAGAARSDRHRICEPPSHPAAEGSGTALPTDEEAASRVLHTVREERRSGYAVRARAFRNSEGWQGTLPDPGTLRGRLPHEQVNQIHSTNA